MSQQVQHTSYDVVVVGGGMVGAATALGLAQLNLTILLLERSKPKLDWQGDEPFSIRVSALTRSSENILRNLGAWSGIEQRRSQAFTSMRVWEQGSSHQMCFDARDIHEPNLGYTVENDVVQAALWEQILQMENITIDYGKEMVSLALPETANKESDALAKMTFADKSVVETKLVVAADGAFSKARSLALIGVEQMDYEQCAVVGCVKTEKAHQNACWQRYTQDGPFAFLAMAEGYSSVAWYLPLEKMQWALNLSDQAFAKELEKASGGELGAITQVTDRGAFPLVRRHAKHYVKPRFALVGDSAHTINPQAGQGVNIGLLDAAVLIQEIELSLMKHRELGNLPSLRRYERARRGDNAIVQRSMEFFDWFYEQSDGVKPALRHKVMPLMESDPVASMCSAPVKKWLMRQVLNGRDPLPTLAKNI